MIMCVMCSLSASCSSEENTGEAASSDVAYTRTMKRCDGSGEILYEAVEECDSFGNVISYDIQDHVHNESRKGSNTIEYSDDGMTADICIASDSHIIITYDERGNTIETTYYSGDELESKETYLYNEYGDLLECYSEEKNRSEPIVKEKNLYKYDSDGKMTEWSVIDTFTGYETETVHIFYDENGVMSEGRSDNVYGSQKSHGLYRFDENGNIVYHKNTVDDDDGASGYVTEEIKEYNDRGDIAYEEYRADNEITEYTEYTYEYR